MIHIKLFSEKEWLKAMGVPEKPDQKPADVEWFEGLLECCLEEAAERPPFRDKESVEFLREGGITFVSDEDWYSIYYEEGSSWKTRDSISSIPKWIKFSLVAIYYSRQGRYTWMNGTCVPDEWAWSRLSSLPFDILFAVKTDDIRSIMPILGTFIRFSPFQIVNYPYRKQSIEVTVKEVGENSPDFCTKVSDSHEDNPCYGLLVGKDGKYYSNRLSVEYAFLYYWKNDIEGILQHIEKNYPERPRLLKVYGLYNADTLSQVLDDYVGSVEEDFQFISHMVFVPKDVTFRKLPMMMVDINYDGTYWIHGSLTVKYPEFAECISDVVEERSPDKERVILVVNVEEMLSSARDVDQAVYGFRLLQDSLEIFDSYEAVQLFGKALKEAYTSGSCTVN